MSLYFSESRLYRITSISFLFILLLYWWRNYHIDFSKEASHPKQSLLFFNVADSKTKNRNVITDNLKTYNVDTAILVESHFLSKESAENFEKAFDTLHTKFLYGSMFAVSKYPIEYVKYLKEFKKYRLSHIEINKEKPLSIAIVDIYTNPLFDRSYSLNKILAYVEANEIDIIIGDFNTPFESVHFKDYKKNYIAMRNYQDGFSATWPYGIPLLELDQMWIRHTLIPRALKKRYFSTSDHAMLIGFFE